MSLDGASVSKFIQPERDGVLSFFKFLSFQSTFEGCSLQGTGGVLTYVSFLVEHRFQQTDVPHRVLDVETRVVRLGGVAHVARGPFAAASPDPSRVYLANTAEEVVDAWRHDCVGFEVRW